MELLYNLQHEAKQCPAQTPAPRCYVKDSEAEEQRDNGMDLLFHGDFDIESSDYGGRTIKHLSWSCVKVALQFRMKQLKTLLHTCGQHSVQKISLFGLFSVPDSKRRLS